MSDVPAPPGLVSVVLLCCGQLEHLCLCLPSVLRGSRPPFAVLALDAASLDGTAEFLAGAQAADAPLEVVRAPADADLPDALRLVLARVQGDFLVLLNSDTVVPEGWLVQLTALAAMNPAIGMVGPMTTYGPAAQLVTPVPYRLGRTADELSPEQSGAAFWNKRIEAVNRFAAEWREQHRGQWFEAERLGGGCVLLRREALEAVGPPPAAPLAFFEAEALSQRVRQAGFHLACCRDLFVHSSGSRGFAPASLPSEGSR